LFNPADWERLYGPGILGSMANIIVNADLGSANRVRLMDYKISIEEKSEVARNINIEIPHGKLTTLIGPSGSGKTTVIDLVIGLLMPQAGHTLVDKVTLDKLDMRAWRRMIGYVPQETLLLHASIAHNVTLGDPGLSE